VVLLDRDHLQMLIGDGPNLELDLLAELHEIYAGESQVLLSRLDAAVTGRAVSEAIHAVHALSGSSANMGAARMHMLCRHIESDLKTGLIDEGFQAAAHVRPAFQQTLAALEAVIRSGRL
jgi:HPt (histidine-containing phosphotransfer) domain-containing protein